MTLRTQNFHLWEGIISPGHDDSPGLDLPGPMTAEESAAAARAVSASVARIALVTSLLMATYALSPAAEKPGRVWIAFGLALAALAAAIIYQVRRILAGERPGLRAVETLATTAIAVVLVFAFVYLSLSTFDASNFSEPLSHISAVYLSVTIVATVGFGDITATTDLSRLIVTFHMLVNLALIGIVARMVLGAARIGQRRQTEISVPEQND